ncbi:MAG: hypothetical protein AAF726_13390 [Planctomycetota bacterium]
MKTPITLAALALTLLAPSAAQTVTILDFDDLVGMGPMPTGYGGIDDWGSWSYSDVPNPSLPPSSGEVRLSSNDPQRILRFGREVIFGGVSIVCEAPYQLRFIRDGQVVSSSQFRPPNAGGPPFRVAAGSVGPIDAIRLVTSTDAHAIDDLVYAEVPSTLGDIFCTPNQTNSLGGWGVLTASGSSVVADNDLTLHVTDLPQNSFGFAIVSATQGFLPGVPGPGILCLNGEIGRYVGPGQIQNSGSSGSFDLSIDLGQIPTPTGFVPTMAGDTWNFQAWYRDFDPVNPPVPTSHFTSGVEIVFQ